MSNIKPIQKLAIANRGEVAVRIIRAAKDLGISTVLLHSEADVKTRAYRLADECVCIGPAPTTESYLDIKANVNAALRVGADAVHPGFGFLSENSDFAAACIGVGLNFVGPSPKTIAVLGDKIQAKALMKKANVPCIPGYSGDDQNLSAFREAARRIGYPVLIKATAGGGGRGMKVARAEEELEEMLESAKREAKSAFGNSTVFMEKYLTKPKHIEFQIFADSYGDVIHLFERECTVQRRHQKIIEEAQSASISEELRQSMADAAVRAAREADYIGAGTVEFLVDGEQFYFLEINTRLQVEHPVTEMLLNIDLVKAQIAIAEGKTLPWQQSELRPQGHAIECRLYAEDPYKNGMPSTGEILASEWPKGDGIRLEVGIDPGDVVSPFYDSMVAKIIVHDIDRFSCIQKALKVLDQCILFGVKSNIPYLKKILNHPSFLDASMTTDFIAKYFPQGLDEEDLSDEELNMLEYIYFVSSRSVELDSKNPFNGFWRSV